MKRNTKPRKHKRPPPRPRRSYQPEFDWLEPRLLLATQTWTGGGDGVTWSDANNWGGTAIASGDDLVFAALGAGVLNNDTAIGTFNSLSFTGGGFTLTGNAVTLALGVNDASTGPGDDTVGLMLGGAGSVTMNSPGTNLILEVANQYSGGTTITAGTLQVGDGTAGHDGTLGSGPVINNGGLAFAPNSTLHISPAITGIGSLTQNGPGLTDLQGANSYTGATTISAGTLSIIGSVGSVDVGTGSILAIGDDGSGTGTVGTLNAGLTTFAPGSALEIRLNGTGPGSSDQLISSANIDLSNATLAISQLVTTNLNNSFVILSTSGTLGGNFTNAASITNKGRTYSIAYDAGAGTVSLTDTTVPKDTSWEGTKSNLWSDSGNWSAGIPTSGDTIHFDTTDANFNNVFDPDDDLGFALNDITLIINDASAAGDFDITSTSGKVIGLAAAGVTSSVTTGTGATIALGLQLQSGATTFATNGNALTDSGILSGTGSLNIGGSGTLVLSGNNTFTGDTAITSGTLQIDSNTALGTGTLNASGGAILQTSMVAGVTMTSSFVIGTGGATFGGGNPLSFTPGGTGTLNGTLTVSNTSTTTLEDDISGTGAIHQTAGILILSGNNSYTGDTTVTGASLQFDSNSALGFGILNAAGGAILQTSVVAGATLSNSFVIGAGGATFGGIHPISFIPAGTGTLNDALTVSNTSTTTLSDDISGTAGINQSAGTLVLSGNDTYTGDTSVSSGTLQVDTSTALGTGTLNASGGSIIQTSVVAGVTLSNSFIIGAGGATFGGSNSLAFTPTGTGTLNGTLTVSNSGTTTLSDDIAGTSGILQTTGTLILSGNNTYVGDTTVTGGNLQVDSNAALGSGTLNASGGIAIKTSVVTGVTLSNTFIIGTGGATLAGANPLSIASGGTGTLNSTLTVTNSSTTTLGNDIGGTSGINQSAGTLILSGNDTYTGSTTVTGGTLEVDSNSALGAGSLNAAGGTIVQTSVISGVVLSNSFVIGTGGATFGGSNPLSFTASGTGTLNGTLTVSNSGTTNFADDLSGTGAIKQPAGTLILSGNNTFSGDTTVTAGALQIDSSRALGTGTLNASGGSVILTSVIAGVTLSNSFVIGLGGATLGGNNPLSFTPTGTVSLNGTLTVNNSSTTNLSENISGTAGINQSAGTLVLSGNNTFTGDTTITGGTLQIDRNSALGAGTLNASGGAAFQTSVTAGVTLTNSFIIGAGGAGIGGAKPFSFSPPGTGTLNGTLTVSNVSLTNLGDTIGGTSGITQSAGTLILSRSNTFTGGVSVTGGTLQIDNNDALGAGILNASGGSVVQTSVAAGVSLANSFTIGVGGATFGGNNPLSFTSAGTGTLSGVLTASNASTTTLSDNISGTGGIDQTAGTLILSGSNTFTGGTTTLGGFLRVDGNSALGTGTLNASGGAAVQTSLVAGVTLINSFVIGTGGAIFGGSNPLSFTSAGTGTLDGTLTVSDSSTTTLGADMSGTSGINQGAGTLILSGNNSYTGDTTVSGSVLETDSNTALGLGNLVASGGITVQTALVAGVTLGNSFVVGAGGVTFGGTKAFSFIPTGTGTLNTTLTVSNTSITTLSDNIGGAGGISQTAGWLVLSGSNTYLGNTDVSNGNLQLGNDTALGAGTLNLLNNSVLQSSSIAGVTLANSFTLVASGATISGSNPLTFTSPGTATLNGQLTVSNTSRTILGDNIGNGATSGRILQTAGVLVLAGNNTYSGNTTVTAGILRLGISQAIPNGPGKGVLVLGSGAVFDLNDFSTNVNQITASGTVDNLNGSAISTLTVGVDNSSSTFSGIIQSTSPHGGSVALTKAGSGSLTLSGPVANTYTGDTNVIAGTLALGNRDQISRYSALVIASNALVDLQNHSDTVGILKNPISGRAGNINLGSANLGIAEGAGIYNGTISGTGGVVVNGDLGTLDSSFGGGPGPDPNFDSHGIISSAFGTSASVADVIVQPDSHIVIVGSILVGGVSEGLIVRLNADGSLDTSFGGTGILKVNFVTGFRGVAYEPTTDDIIVVGNTTTSAVVAAYHRNDGSPDLSFHLTGSASVPLPGTDTGSASALEIQNDGKIVVVGTDRPTPTTGTVFVARFNAGGSLDAANFGSGTGVAVLGDGAVDNGNTVALQLTTGTQKIAIGGSSGSRAALWELNSDGTSNATFVGPAGEFVLPLGPGFSSQAINNVIFGPNNQLLAVGTNSTNATSSSALLLSVNAAGNLAFQKTITFGGTLDGASAVVLAPDLTGDFIVVGTTNAKTVTGGGVGHDVNDGIDPRAESQNFALERFDASGNPVAFGSNANGPFGTNSVDVTDFFHLSDVPTAVALQTNGELIVAGTSSAGTQNAVALAEYYNGPGVTQYPMQTFAGTNTYTGTTIIDGTLTLTPGAIPTTSAVVVGSAGTSGHTDNFGTLNLNGATIQIGSLSGNGLVDLNGTSPTGGTLLVGSNNASTDFFGSIRGIGGQVIKTGTGTLTYRGTVTNSYTGDTRVIGGALNLGKMFFATVGPNNSLVNTFGIGLSVNGNNEAILGNLFIDSGSVTLLANDQINNAASVFPSAAGTFSYGNSDDDFQSPTLVTNLDDSGVGSLRQAILNAIAFFPAPGGASITFQAGLLPSVGVGTVFLQSTLPVVTTKLRIDPTPSSTLPHLQLDGTGTASGRIPSALDLRSAGGTLRGLVLSNFLGSAILVESSNNTITGNYVGTDSSGSTTDGNSGNGINVSVGSGNVISGNLISGNAQSGILLNGSATATSIENNLIGTDATGTSALANGNDGIDIKTGSANTITHNTISGNSQEGILIEGSASVTTIQGNRIGTDISGTAPIANGTAGIDLSSGSGNIVSGNVISGNGESGILLRGSANGAIIQSNEIGTDATGTIALANLTNGITINSGPGHFIGSNVISANGQNGILIQGSAAGVALQFNFIGTNAAGTTALANGSNGVAITNGTGHVIDSNVISGNAQSGIILQGTSTSRVLVRNNRVGTNGAGTQALGNGADGILVDGSPNNTITAGNVIGGNGQDGILLSNTSGNLLQGTFFGTDRTGTINLGNAGAGVHIIDSTNNIVGGLPAGFSFVGLPSGIPNVIAFNLGGGVTVEDPAPTFGNALLTNSIYGNRTALGIFLGTGVGGSTLNGKLTVTQLSFGSTQGQVAAAANSTYLLQIFGNDGQTYLGEVVVQTDTNGSAFFSFPFDINSHLGSNFRGTVTDLSGDTSEFSSPFSISPTPAVQPPQTPLPPTATSSNLAIEGGLLILPLAVLPRLNFFSDTLASVATTILTFDSFAGGVGVIQTADTNGGDVIGYVYEGDGPYTPEDRVLEGEEFFLEPAASDGNFYGDGTYTEGMRLERSGKGGVFTFKDVQAGTYRLRRKLKPDDPFKTALPNEGYVTVTVMRRSDTKESGNVITKGVFFGLMDVRKRIRRPGPGEQGGLPGSAGPRAELPFEVIPWPVVSEEVLPLPSIAPPDTSPSRAVPRPAPPSTTWREWLLAGMASVAVAAIALPPRPPQQPRRGLEGPEELFRQ